MAPTAAAAATIRLAVNEEMGCYKRGGTTAAGGRVPTLVPDS